MDCIWVNLKNVGPPLFKFRSVYVKQRSFSFFVAVVLQMQDACSANLMFRAHN